MPREMPRSEEAEQLVLGYVLRTGAYEEVAEQVRSADFYSQAHRLIFETMRTLSLRGVRPDVVTVANYLAEFGLESRVGGRLYLNDLLSRGSGSESVAYHGGIVRVKAARRRMIEAGARVGELGYDETLDPEALYTQALDEVTDAGRGVGQGAIKHVSALGDDFMGWINRQRSGETGGVGTGYGELDRIVGDLTGCLVVVAGATSMGKSVMMLNMAWRLAQEGVPVGYLTLEMTPEQLMKRLVQCAGQIPLGRLRYTPDDELRRVVKLVCSRLLFLCTFTENTLWSVLGQARELVGRHGCRVVFVDYLQELTIPSYKGERYQEVGAVARALRGFALKHRVEIVAGSQISRDASKDKGRPKLHQLRESGDIENSMDVGIGLYREAYYEPTLRGDADELEAIVLKHRNGDTGTVKMTLFRQEQRIEEGFSGEAPEKPKAPRKRARRNGEEESDD